MSVLSDLVALIRPQATTEEARATPLYLYQPSSALLDAFGVVPSAAGETVNELTSLRLPAVTACIRVVAESVAGLPFGVYQKQDRKRREAEDHPLHGLLHNAPNPEMTSFTWRETTVAHVLGWGNAFSWVQRDGGGRVVGLWPLLPNRMTVMRNSAGRIVYIYTPVADDLDPVVYPFEEVYHLKGLSGDGLVGYSPIKMAKQAIALGLATEKFGAKFFSNGTHYGGFFEHPSRLSPEAYERLLHSVNSSAGSESAHKTRILEEGMKYTANTIPPDDAQFLETRKFQVREIARIFRVPPHKIGDLEQATFSNIEHQAIEFVVDTVRPWLVRMEQEADFKLLTEAERRGGFYTHFTVDGLLRGDIQTRYQAYQVAVNNGWLSPNDVRELEDKDPIPDGDTFFVPMNLVPLEQAIEPPEPVPAPLQEEPPQDQEDDQQDQQDEEPAPDTSRARRVPPSREERKRQAKNRAKLARQWRPVFEDAGRRVVNRERQEIERLLERNRQRDRGTFLASLNDLYRQGGKLEQYTFQQLFPIVFAYASQIADAAAAEIEGDVPDLTPYVRNYSETATARYLASSRRQMEKLVADSEDDIESAVRQRLDDWEKARPEKVSRRETVEASSYTAKTVWRHSGITRIEWNASGMSCPFCKHLDGAVVGIENNFLEEGGSLTVEGEEPFTASSPRAHPPLHDGCDCQLSAD